MFKGDFTPDDARYLFPWADADVDFSDLGTGSDIEVDLALISVVPCRVIAADAYVTDAFTSDDAATTGLGLEIGSDSDDPNGFAVSGELVAAGTGWLGANAGAQCMVDTFASALQATGTFTPAGGGSEDLGDIDAGHLIVRVLYFAWPASLVASS
jgi:hypothetical protein